MFRIEKNTKIVTFQYMVIDAIRSYNMIMGIPSLNQLGAVVLTPHLCMKYPLDQHQIGTMRVDQKMARK